MVPQVLQLKEIEPPRELAAALSLEFLGRLNIANPPPVQLLAMEQWSGYCHSMDATDRGEVVLADWRIPSPDWAVLQNIRSTYVHEAAHRLIGQVEENADSHGLEFFTLLLFLLRRAGKRRDGYPWFIFWKGYDLGDCLEPRGIVGVPSAGDSIDWAMELALELAEQEITAEAAAVEICKLAQAWKKEVAAAPGRREAAQKATREKFEALQAALGAARDKIFWWRLYFGAASFLAAAIFFLAISTR